MTRYPSAYTLTPTLIHPPILHLQKPSFGSITRIRLDGLVSTETDSVLVTGELTVAVTILRHCVLLCVFG